MNLRTILCYGDSNTWGYVPNENHAAPKARYSRAHRWPGLLQKRLGLGYYVIEEGLNSRTTNIDYAVPPDRNGKTYLMPCLYSHSPLDLVIFALGGNDAKTYFNRSPDDITEGLAELVDLVQGSQYGPALLAPPKILILTPAIPMRCIEEAVDEAGVKFLIGAVDKITALKDTYRKLAKQKKCDYLDLSGVKPSEIDGVHFDEAAHQVCSELISKKVKDIF